MVQRFKPETLKLLEEIIASTLHDTDIGKNILNNTLLTQEMKPTINKQDFVKLEGFHIAKETIN